MTLTHDPMGPDPLGMREIARSRRALSERIDEAVKSHLSDELLGELVKHTFGLRYLGASEDRLKVMIEQMVDRYTRKLIVEWIREHEDGLYEGVNERLQKVHLPKLGEAIVDEFMAEHSK